MLKTVPALITQCCDQRAKRKQARNAAAVTQVVPPADSKTLTATATANGISTRVNVAG